MIISTFLDQEVIRKIESSTSEDLEKALAEIREKSKKEDRYAQGCLKALRIQLTEEEKDGDALEGESLSGILVRALEFQFSILSKEGQASYYNPIVVCLGDVFKGM